MTDPSTPAAATSLSVGTPVDGVVTVTLDRPGKLNAFTFEMFDELTAACARIEADDAARVVVLTGAGRGFCAGLDLDCVAALLEMSPYMFLRGQEKWAGAALALHRLTKPVIAAVNGAAAGAGLSLALAADFRIASENARFNAAFIRVGLTGGDMGSSWLLPRIVGLGIANELLLTGRIVEAAEAARIGLVNHVLAPEDLMPAALELARQIAANTPFGVRATKQAVRTNLGAASLDQGIELENRNQALAAGTVDMREALAAFLERRQPVYVGD